MSKASVYFTVDGIDGNHDIKELKRKLDMLHGIQSVSINKQGVAIDFDTTGIEQDRIQKKINNLGYVISDVRFENHIM